jgi:hypothetical protein
MTAVSHWPNVIESKPVSAPPIAVAIDDRNARTALKIADAHALCADILIPLVLVGSGAGVLVDAVTVVTFLIADGFTLAGRAWPMSRAAVARVAVCEIRVSHPTATVCR